MGIRVNWQSFFPNVNIVTSLKQCEFRDPPPYWQPVNFSLFAINFGSPKRQNAEVFYPPFLKPKGLPAFFETVTRWEAFNFRDMWEILQKIRVGYVSTHWDRKKTCISSSSLCQVITLGRGHKWALNLPPGSAASLKYPPWNLPGEKEGKKKTHNIFPPPLWSKIHNSFFGRTRLLLLRWELPVLHNRRTAL